MLVSHFKAKTKVLSLLLWTFFLASTLSRMIQHKKKDGKSKKNTSLIFFFLQRALRLADAKAVEAKAARIKDWVTNKLRELEEQNAHLKVQNAKANDQMELLRNRLEQLQELGATTKSRQTSMIEVMKFSFFLSYTYLFFSCFQLFFVIMVTKTREN